MAQGSPDPALGYPGGVKVVEASVSNLCTQVEAPGGISGLRGNIALAERGSCFFTTLVLRLQEAGAVGVIVSNNADSGFFKMAEPTWPLVRTSLSLGYYCTLLAANGYKGTIFGVSSNLRYAAERP